MGATEQLQAEVTWKDCLAQPLVRKGLCHVPGEAEWSSKWSFSLQNTSFLH